MDSWMEDGVYMPKIQGFFFHHRSLSAAISCNALSNNACPLSDLRAKTTKNANKPNNIISLPSPQPIAITKPNIQRYQKPSRNPTKPKPNNINYFSAIQPSPKPNNINYLPAIKTKQDR